MEHKSYSLSGATLVTPEEVSANGVLTVSNGCIASLERANAGHDLDLGEHLIFPGLINAHDHLLGTWWPRVAPGRPYANVYEWLDDYEKSPVVQERGLNSAEEMYELGAYRNLISGATTVADHYKRTDSAEFYARHPIHILHQYGRSWLPRTDRQAGWGGDISTEYTLAVRRGQPYIIHLAEGVDKQAATEMDVLLEANALGRNTMVIHGIALRPDDMRLMAEAGASVCLCPASNLFLYGQTADVPELLRSGVNLTLGTDSPMTGGLNILDEVRTARRAFRDEAGAELSSRWLIESVTTHAAYALMMQDHRGRIAPGYEADLLVLPDSHRDPYTALVEADVGDISLLTSAGVPVYGDACHRSFFERFAPHVTAVSVSGRDKLMAGDPLGLLDRLSHNVGRKLDFPFLPCAAP